MANSVPESATTPKKKLEFFRAEAQAYMEKHGCRWSEATLAIKKKYPEARAAFGAPEPSPARW